jgi:hypothetical protein
MKVSWKWPAGEPAAAIGAEQSETLSAVQRAD